MLKFWHWIDAEESILPGYAYDGGILEIKEFSEGNWTQITPVNGYPHTIKDDPRYDGPFSAGETECYSGQHDWQEEEFDLSDYHLSVVKIRYRFGTDGYETYEGWYIDDVAITGEETPVRMFLTQDDEVVQRGDSTGYTIKLKNNTDQTQTCIVWTEVTLPNGNPHPRNPHMGPVQVTLQPYETKSNHYNDTIPQNAPSGEYTYIGFDADQYPDPAVIYSQDGFILEVIE